MIYNKKANAPTEFELDINTSSSTKCINKGKSIEDSIWKCGPPAKYGGYEKYNWCSRCHTLESKDIRYCQDCGCQLRTTSKYKFGTYNKPHLRKALNTRKI
tara:strand:- start:137 stop:439 length:303 start_codon:yes stop_codon:yes gene_type:complete